MSYFNESYDQDCGKCDVCNNPQDKIDGTTLCQMALSAMARTQETIGFMTLIDILRGSRKSEILAKGYDKLKTYGVGHDLTQAMWNSYLLQMLQLGLIYIAYEEDDHLKSTSFGREVLYGKRKIQLSRFYYNQPAKKKPAESSLPIIDEHDVDMVLLSKLKDTRKALARAKGVPPYMIFSDKVLTIMAQEKPVAKAQFDTLYGVGEHKTNLYWRQFTTVIKNYIERNK